MTKHKVFISFYHEDDQRYKNCLDKMFEDKVINKSVSYGEYDPDDSDEYIKRLIREEKITDSSVIIVLVGKKTRERKHVDWEIYAGLRKSVNGRAGLVGVYLPEVEDRSDREKFLPKRLKDNVDSGYAEMYDWNEFIDNYEDIIDDAFSNKDTWGFLAKNSREQKKING